MTFPQNTMGQSDRLAHSVLTDLSAASACHFVCSPGGRNAPFSFALSGMPTVGSTVILDERMAAFFALGRARSRPDELVVLICTSGSAGAHYLPALIEADYSGVPLFVITSDRPNHLRNTGAAQTIEQRNFFGHHVVASDHVDVHDTPDNRVRIIVSDLVDSALRLKGPVHLNVGFDEPLHDASFIPPVGEPKHRLKTSQPDPNDVGMIIDALDSAQSGMIIWGPNACTTSAEREAAHALMTSLQWPAFTHGASNLRGLQAPGLLPYSFDHGIATGLMDEQHSQCILYVGQAPTSRMTLGYLTSVQSTKVVSITKGRHVVQPWKHGSAFTAQSATMLTRIAGGLRTREPIDSTLYDMMQKRISLPLQACDGPKWWAGGIIRSLVNQLPDHTHLHVGNSLIIRDLDLYCDQTKASVSIFANRGVNGIDGQIATAAGMASTSPDHPNVLLCGDLTALHDSGALPLAKQVGLTICVIDNSGGAIFDHLPFAEETDAFERFFTTPQSTDLATIAKAYGLDVQVISEKSEMPTIQYKEPGQASLYVFSVDAGLGKAERYAMLKRMEAIPC